MAVNVLSPTVVRNISNPEVWTCAACYNRYNWECNGAYLYVSGIGWCVQTFQNS